MKVALIGGTGFVGGYLVDALLKAGHEPSLLVRAGSGAKVREASRCRLSEGDLDDPEALYTEWAKFAAWRSHGRLERLIDELAFASDPEAVAAELDAAVAEVAQAAAEMRAGARQLDHYGG